MILLFRCSTGEDWYIIMFDLNRDKENRKFFNFCFLFDSNVYVFNHFLCFLHYNCKVYYAQPIHPCPNRVIQ